MRTAFASIAWKTADSSPGELEMTRRTSEAAVCCSRASASSWVRASSCFFNSISEFGPLLTRALAFVPVERSLRPRVGLFAPLRDKVTSSAQPLVPPSGRPSQGSGLPILTHDELASSLDHLVGAGEQRWRHIQAERLRSTNVDDKLERGRLHDSQVRRRSALENPARVDADLAVCIGITRAVGHEPTGCGEFAPIVNRRNCVACC